MVRCCQVTYLNPRLCSIFLLVLLWGGSAQARSFQGVVTHISDGDTLWVRPVSGGEPRKVRFQGIDAPEICQDFGPQSRDALAARLLHQSVLVGTRARDSYGRVLGRVTLGGEDIGAWMVLKGYAWSYHYRRSAGPYASEETRARQSRRGLFAVGQPELPRDFRQRHGTCHAMRR
ncbi:thermonuclease family protein [Rhodoferax ferrireducens]|uniref:thermonuclease family protein n=1 Tax=Rhodoferax ferrireducens TaxID=192843 RepID=UPI000E0D9380|nr:thermonuclease family protein [Rhodoferax ferrireducens]